MAVQIIPDGSPVNAIISKESGYDYGCDLRDSGDYHILNAIAGVERAVGLTHAGAVGAIKDSACDIERAVGEAHASTVGMVKDAEANLAATAGQHFGIIQGAVKDAEADLERAAGLHYADTVKTIKDSEVGVERTLGRGFADTARYITDAESTLERASGETRDVVRQAQLSVEAAKAAVLSKLGHSDLENCKGFDNVKSTVEKGNTDLTFRLLDGFKDNLLQFKEADLRAYKISAAAERRASDYQRETLLQFKDVELRQQKLAAEAAEQLAECCCEMKMMLTADGNATRALINQQETDRLRERANKAEQTLQLLQITGVSAARVS